MPCIYLCYLILIENLEAIKIDLADDIRPAVKVNDIIGSALPQIGAYKKLDNTKQVVALIDDVRINKMNIKLEVIVNLTIFLTGLMHQLRKMLYDMRRLGLSGNHI